MGDAHARHPRTGGLPARCYAARSGWIVLGVEADIINHHALEASGGATYAELEQDDPVRDTVMDASFLRASLFTSVVAFGVCALVVGLGIVLGVIGGALQRLSRAA